MTEAEATARAFFGDVFDQLTAARQQVLVTLAASVGRDRLAGFADLRSAVRSGNAERCREEILDTLWATQAPSLARLLGEKYLAG